MRRHLDPILLLSHEVEPPGWLKHGVPTGTPVLCSSDAHQARRLLQRGTVHILICDVPPRARDEILQLLTDTVRDLPSVATIGLVSRGRTDSDELLRMARTGVHALLFEEDRRVPMLVQRVLVEAATRCRSDQLWSHLEPMTPHRVRPIVAYGLKHAHQALTVDGVARALGLHRKTLAERCSRSGTLPPQQVLGWCRLLAAASLLEDRGRLVDHVAMELDFPSGGAFRNMLKRYTGLSPAELRAKGTISEMSRQFVRAVSPVRLLRTRARAS